MISTSEKQNPRENNDGGVIEFSMRGKTRGAGMSRKLSSIVEKAQREERGKNEAA